jgi:hypothetical protein
LLSLPLHEGNVQISRVNVGSLGKSREFPLGHPIAAIVSDYVAFWHRHREQLRKTGLLPQSRTVFAAARQNRMMMTRRFILGGLAALSAMARVRASTEAPRPPTTEQGVERWISNAPARSAERKAPREFAAAWGSWSGGTAVRCTLFRRLEVN